ncbi:MAG: TrmB family transcriptional regulator [Candidatus Gracilibacteria bacterium]
MIEQTLQDLGLSIKETKVYLALLKTGGEATTIEIAQEADLPRTTVYDLLVSLGSKGIVVEKKRGSTKVFDVDTPQHLLAYISKQEMQLMIGKEHLKAVMGDLERLKNPLLPAASLSLYAGQEGLLRMWETHIQTAIQTERTIRFICNAQFFAQMSGEMKALGKRFEAEGCIVKVLVHSPEEDPVFLKTRNFEVKTVRQVMAFTSGMNVAGPYIGYWTEQGSSLQASSLENPQVAEMQKALFESLWAVEI